MKLSLVRYGSWLMFFAVMPALAVNPTFTWKADGTNTGVFELNTNWADNIAPPLPTEPPPGDLVFGVALTTNVDLFDPAVANSLKFTGSFTSYVFRKNDDASLSIGAGGILVETGATGPVDFQAGLGLVLTANQTWALNSTNGFNVAGPISGGFKLTKSGTGMLSLSGANTYTGGTEISQGTLRLDGSGSLPSGGNLTISALAGASARLELSGNPQSIGTLTLGGADAESNTSIQLSSSTLTLGGTVTHDASNNPAGADISGGTLALGSADPRVFEIGDSTNANAELTISSSITGAGLEKTGGGTLVLAGDNAYTGATLVSAGTLSAAHANALGSTAGGVVVSAGATLDINYAAIGLESISVSGFGVNGVGGITGTGISSLAGAVTLTGNTGIGSGGELTLSGAIGEDGGPRSLTKLGSGTLILAAANTYTGPTAITGGTLRLGADNALPATQVVTVSSSGGVPATLDLAGHAQTLAGLVLGAGMFNNSAIVSIGTAGTLTLNGIVTYDPANSPAGAWISDGILAWGGGSRTFQIGDSSMADADLTISANISGTGAALEKTGGGTLVLAGANTYTGSTLVSGGTLGAAHASALGTTDAGVAVSAGATLDINNAVIGAESVTVQGMGVGGVGALTGTGYSSLAGAVTLAANAGIGTNDEFTLSGVIGESGGPQSLTKLGYGTLILTAGNTYTGGTTVNSGILQIGNGGETGGIAGSVNVSTYDAGLVFNRSDNITFAGSVSGGGWLEHAGSGTLTLTGENSHNGGTYIGSWEMEGGGILQIGAGGTSGSLPTFGNVENWGTLVFDRSDSVFLGGQIYGGGSVVKKGTNTLTLGSSGNYFGNLVIEGGMVEANSLGTYEGGIISMGGNTTLRYTGWGEWTDRSINLAGAANEGVTIEARGSGAVEFAGGVTATAPGAKTLTLISNNWSTSSIEGSISDGTDAPIKLVKSGFGEWALYGANSYTGGTVINGGRLYVQNYSEGYALPAGRDVTINATSGRAALHLSDSVQSIGALTLGGTGASPFATNMVLSGWGGQLNLGGDVTYLATNNPSGAFIAVEDVYDGYNPFGGTLSLGAPTRNFVIGNSSNTDTELTIYSNIINGDGPSGIAKSGSGALLLAGNSTYSGGTTVTQGALYLGSNTNDQDGVVSSGPVGTGTLVMGTGTALAAVQPFVPWWTEENDIRVANSVQLAGNVTLGAAGRFHQLSLELGGAVTISDATAVLNLGGNEDVLFSGSLNGAAANTAVTFASPAGVGWRPAILFGTVGENVASLTADRSALIFASPASLSGTAGVSVANNGYVGIGIGDPMVIPSANALITKITNKGSFAGTFGFDSDEDYPQTFSENVDFSEFGPGMTIGSISAAVLTGEITPPAHGYAFGNGGGALIVDSNLTDTIVDGQDPVSVPVSISSAADNPENALTVIFRGENSYTGGLSVTNSLGVLDSPGALPGVGLVTLGGNGYLGYTEAFTGVPAFSDLAARLAPGYSPSAILGFDSHDFILQALGEWDPPLQEWEDPWGMRYVGEPLDLSNLSEIYIGTTTRAALEGRIIAPAGGTLKLLAAYEGELVVFSPLLAPAVNSLVVGSNTNDFSDGFVVLLGESTYAGGTTFLSGTLALPDNTRSLNGAIRSGPLGTGTLTVPAGAIKPTLIAADWYRLALENNISLGARLRIGSEESGGMGEESVAQSGEDDYGRIILKGAISGSGGLDILQDAVLAGNNSFSGGVKLLGGELGIGSNTALGTGLLEIAPNYYGEELDNVGLRVLNGSRTIANNINLNLSSGEDYWGSSLPVLGKGSLTVTGNVNLNGGVRFLTGRYPLFLEGSVTGAGQLSASGGAAVVLRGTNNTYSGGTRAEYGAVIFTTAAGIPAAPSNGLSAGSQGYIGLATPPSNLQADFIDRFNKGETWGTIGFDTRIGYATNTFTGDIDLSGFVESPRLGSATSAVLSGTIAPADDYEYEFGGGGGFLEVASNLTDSPHAYVPTSDPEDYSTAVELSPRSVEVDSISFAPLTVRLTGDNTYSGNTNVYSSALIFGAGAMPPLPPEPASEQGGYSISGMSYGQFYAGDMGYIGTEDASNVPGFIDRFYTGTSYAIVGFDSFTGSPLEVGAVSLSRFDDYSYDRGIFIGTTTRALINGAITLPNMQNRYRFAGYKGGILEVATPLTDLGPPENLTPRSVQIGENGTPATAGTPTQPTYPLSKVILSGANTYTGGTLLEAGLLLLGGPDALGSAIGTLTVDGSDSDYFGDSFPSVGLGATTTLMGADSIPNPITLYSDFMLTGSSNFELSGSISDYGYYSDILKTGSSSITLSGDNSNLYGDIYIAEGNLTFAHPNAVGNGALEMGGTLGPSATFAVSSIVNGIFGDQPNDQIKLGSEVTLTVNQPFDSIFAGKLTSTGSVSVQYWGSGYYVTSIPNGDYYTRLVLSGDSTYTGTTTIGTGVSILAAHNNVFGSATTNTVRLEGGRLEVDEGITIAKQFQIASEIGGTLAGNGTIASMQTLVIGSGVAVSPGIDGVGDLNFSNTLGSAPVLSLASGGRYDLQMLDASSTTGSWDTITVTGAVDIAATSGAPFQFKITPYAGESMLASVAGFDPFADYSWSVLTATSITGLTPGSLVVDPSSLIFNFAPGAVFGFSVADISGGQALMLNFTAIPEPSTYVLMGAGALVVFLASRRRRRA